MDPDYGIVTNIAGVDLMAVECRDDHIWVETVAQGAAMSTLGGGAVTPGAGVGACLDTGDTAATALLWSRPSF